MISRRFFIKQSGLAVAATAILPSMFYSCDPNRALGVQLYSLRETIGGDVKGTLEKVAKAGYKEVETFGFAPGKGFWGTSVSEFKNIMAANGLSSPSGHYGMDPYMAESGKRSDFQYAIDVAKGLDQKYVIIPYLSDGLRGSLDDYKRMANKLNEAGQICKDAGLKLAYHNHDFEFKDYNGENGYEYFLQNTDASLVDFEMDIYWVVRAGKDPVALFEKYPGRFPLWHVKDMSKTNNEKNTEIGNGTIDFKKIFEKAKLAGAKHFIVEQENFDMEAYASLKQSHDYIINSLVQS
ncbi:sugar phosphate isomerase/epimerase [Gramella sp. AN32]|uniref:Sugar phosphate isomerase/epimerase family protein n=1 Tax=Christiangramia antarctica TaxID=2058158 RepID=A0ABW5X462_9FLAO|nr:sugar phosphate isomerase/epimerase [Gramella sp. AN32]MCM4156289.1 sugar phosphate isomerase/epimerase [Gramella sp. AN32]